MDSEKLTVDLTSFNRLARHRLQQDMREQAKLRERRKDEADRENGDDLLALAATVVSSAQLQHFNESLSEYDAATVAALQRNDEALAAAEERLALLLEGAFVLPDGRRVFRTEDGRYVFDENGQAIPPEVIEAGDIPDGYTSWEDYDSAADVIRRLVEERRELIEFQEELDEARERANDGDLTQDELDELMDDLERDMPPAVRAELDNAEGPAPSSAPAAPPGIGDLAPAVIPPPSR